MKKPFVLRNHVARFDRGDHELQLRCEITFRAAGRGRHLGNIAVKLTDPIRDELGTDAIRRIEAIIARGLRARPRPLRRHVKMVELYQRCASNLLADAGDDEDWSLL
jgi:hypothetical protein